MTAGQELIFPLGNPPSYAMLETVHVSKHFFKNLSIAIAAPLIIAGSAFMTVHADSNNYIIEGLRRGVAAATGEPYRSSQPDATPVSPAPTPPTTAGTSGQYVALGDSVAAGLGLPAASSTPQNEACGRSSQAYPVLVASTLHKPLANLACSGAKASNLFDEQRAQDLELTPQIDAAFQAGHPALISITIGANDARWVDFIRLCYVSRCDTKTSTTFANSYLQALQLKLYYALFDINARSGGKPPHVYMTGYYNPFSNACQGVEPRITAGELAWLQNEQRDLNQTIQKVAASYPFVTFVPVNFNGHDICSGDSWVQGIDAPAPFHPTATGQQAIARALGTAINH